MPFFAFCLWLFPLVLLLQLQWARSFFSGFFTTYKSHYYY